ncbi:MAG: NAD(P)/FAD-dependent oxidoreductase [bacterium]
MDFDVLILGAGAAGLMCAREAAKRGKTVCVLEKAERAGKKILISGGGRCNFTNLYSRPENFLSENDHFCKSALARFTPADFISLVEKHGIAYYEKKLGQLFCESSAKEITGLLLRECGEAGVKIRLKSEVLSVEKNSAFEIRLPAETLKAHSLVVATGGLSFPKLGGSDLGYRLARQFGLKVTECAPALVPLTWGKKDKEFFSELAGVSLEAAVACGKVSFRENILFTHKGLSGPAVLQISSYWKPGDLLTIDLFPERDLAEWLLDKKLRKERGELKNVLAQILPKRFSELWCERHAPSRPLSEYTDAALRKIAEELHHWRILPEGTEGYEKAEVTRGGVDTSELSSKTLEAHRVPGLYFVGEVMDVTGHLGGHNFQWAWASGFAAGQAV